MKKKFFLLIFFFIINTNAINSMTAQEKIETLTLTIKNKIDEHLKKQKSVNNEDYLTIVLNNLAKIKEYCEKNNNSNTKENTSLEEYLINTPELIQIIIDHSQANYYLLLHGKSTQEINEAWKTLQNNYSIKIQHHNTLTNALPDKLKLEILNGKSQFH